MKITIDPFNKDSVDAAVKMVRQYERDFKRKETEFVRRLAEIGVVTAAGIYSAADYDGEHNVSVYLKKTSNGYSVMADGETVGFLEFGTGIRNREWGGEGLPYTPPPHGSYGKGHGKQPYGWWFKAQEYGVTMHTYGNPPADGMLTARNHMIEKVTQIAREVWK
ncbi:hypothetical protein [Succinimonas sp.]|uniref:hypothetical protein n=1 Tax=Succinimonas sp. TaxID=1936151 RepID=UPI00386636E5